MTQVNALFRKNWISQSNCLYVTLTVSCHSKFPVQTRALWATWFSWVAGTGVGVGLGDGVGFGAQFPGGTFIPSAILLAGCPLLGVGLGSIVKTTFF